MLPSLSAPSPSNFSMIFGYTKYYPTLRSLGQTGTTGLPRGLGACRGGSSALSPRSTAPRTLAPRWGGRVVRAGDGPEKVEGGKEDGREGGKGGALTRVGGYLGDWTQPQMGPPPLASPLPQDFYKTGSYKQVCKTNMERV